MTPSICNENVHSQNTPKENRRTSTENKPKRQQVNTTRIEDASVADKLLASPFAEDELATLSKLSLMNAGARYELLSINEQLLDFNVNIKVSSLYCVSTFNDG